MSKHKLVVPLVVTTLLTGIGMSAVTLVSAASTDSSTVSSATTNTPSGTTMTRGGPQGGHSLGVMGTVSAISGDTLTVTGKDGGTYTVDASRATVKADGSSSSLSSLKIGDSVMITGAITTASMSAADIEDGVPTPSENTPSLAPSSSTAAGH